MNDGDSSKERPASAFCGHVAVIGNLSGIESSMNLGEIVVGNAHLHGIHVGSRSTFEAMNRAISLHRMKPVIHRVYDFSDWREALEELTASCRFHKTIEAANEALFWSCVHGEPSSFLRLEILRCS